jgi:TRAP-type uncharacterized transport system substrate-binding protein
MILTYAYNDYIKPILINIMNGKSIKTTMTEAFTSQYSSLAPSMSNTVEFDTNSYLRDKNKPIIVKNTIALPLINYCYFTTGSYEYLVGNYFRRAIYPVKQSKCITNIEAIYKFINNEIDIAFISEELLSRYIKKDCRYLTRLLAKTFNISQNKLEDEKTLGNLYPPINFSAIGVGFDRDFYLIANNFSNIVEFIDIKEKKIGILADSYYDYIKMCSAYGIDITDDSYNDTQIIETELENLIDDFSENKYDAIFVVLHPKNKLLLEMSKNMKLRYIHIQKKPTLDSRNNLSNLINFDLNNQQGTTTEDNILTPPTLNQQEIYSKTLMDDLKTVNVRENFNSLIKKYFQHIKPRAIDLNKFHKSENKYTYLDTYSTRMILVIRNDIPKERVEYITQNYINNLEKMRNTIDMAEFNTKIDNFSSREFTYQELVSFDNTIPLADGSRTIYKKEGLIYTEDDVRCKV